MSGTHSAAAPISTACVQIFREHTGRGPTEAKTTIMCSNTVVVALGGVLTVAERNLVARGMHDQVRDVRDSLQKAMHDDLIAAVEQALDRQVMALMSDTEVHADLAIQVFTLAPVSHEEARPG